MFFWSPQHAASSLRGIYNSIAPDFSRSRSEHWKECEILFEKTKQYSQILDIGCGNGRLIPLFQQKECRVTGIDIAKNLLNIAKERYPKQQFFEGNFLEIPPNLSLFDEVWAVASFHHLPTFSSRIKALKNISHILKTKGNFVCTVWNLWDQKKYSRARKLAFWRSFLPQWNKRDFLIPWGKEKIARYYYSFSENEIFTLAEKTGFSVVECWGSHDGKKGFLQNSQNICVRLEKNR